MANLKIVATLFNLANLKDLALLINFYLWLLTIGPKLDFWRIFENFGFAVLVLNLPTLDCFLTFLISTHQIHLARVPLFVEGDKCI